jgi:hypothetical protein
LWARIRTAFVDSADVELVKKNLANSIIWDGIDIDALSIAEDNEN